MSSASSQDLLHDALQSERQGRIDEAIQLLRRVLDAGKAALGLEARLRLGRLLTFRGEAEKAEAASLLTQARNSAEEDDSPRQAARAIHQLALLERYRGQRETALRLLDESPVLRLPGNPTAELGQYFHVRGLLAADSNDLTSAERYYFRAHQFYQEAQNDPGIAEVCDSLANLLLKRGNSRPALAFASRSLELKRKLHDRRGEAISLGTLGRAFFLQARYTEARGAFQQDLQLSTELNDQRGVGIMLNSLGEIALLLGDHGAAKDSYEQNLAGNRGPVNALHAYLGLARVYLAGGHIAEAEGCAKQMEALLPELAGRTTLSDAHTGLCGSLSWRRGKVADGERLLLNAIASLQEKGDELETVPFLYELRNLLQSQKRTPEAVKVMSHALDLLSESGDERGVRDVEEWLRTVDSPALIRLALERHFPDYLVEHILTGPLGLQPCKRQEITVLFSDVRDYTTMSEGLEPEQIVELLNEWFTEATRVIRHHGGVVDKFIGDAVMALFGVPEAREDAAADAVRAAVGLRDVLSALNLRNRALGGREIRIGIGLHTGQAVVGFIGSHLRQSYTAIGDVVNMASRLEGVTKDFGCDIVISQNTQSGQERYHTAETEFLGKVKVKGRQQEEPIYKVLGLRNNTAAP